jgi:3-phenylpropionate/trans-cinnamate dioxygenase ferredoxin reductase subunit
MPENPLPPDDPQAPAAIALDDLPEGQPVQVKHGAEDVLLVRRGDNVHAVGAHCTHYGGPLAEGLVVGDTIRCPWHHACFSLQTGEALGAPALAAIATFAVEREGRRVRVAALRQPPPPRKPAVSPASVVILGSGAAGAAAAEALRREGYAGPLTLVGESRRSTGRICPGLSRRPRARGVAELRDDDFYRSIGVARGRDGAVSSTWRARP